MFFAVFLVLLGGDYGNGLGVMSAGKGTFEDLWKLKFCWYLAIYRRFDLLNIYAIFRMFLKQFFPKFSQLYVIKNTVIFYKIKNLFWRFYYWKNLREVNDDILREWFAYRDEDISSLKSAEDKNIGFILMK